MTAPPNGSATATINRHGRYVALGAGVVLAGALTYIGSADPHRAGFLYPTCPFKLVTGLNCPGCGGLRMTHDVLHGNLSAAVMDNVFLLFGLPMLAVWLLFRWRRGERLMPVPAWAVVIVAVTGWTIIRNWPGFPLVPTLLGG
jgi:hypothetical protein